MRIVWSSWSLQGVEGDELASTRHSLINTLDLRDGHFGDFD
jgi:hypothetical protein